MIEMDKDRLARRVHGRLQAKSILELVDLTDPESIDAFLDEITTKLRPPKPADEKLAKIERARAYAEFAEYRLSFGQHQGVPLEDVPRDYLEWLVESNEDTLRMVSGFLELTEE